MRLIFLGAGEFGLPTLAMLHASHQVAAVVTQPDRPAGRRQELTPTAIATWATAAGLPVFKTDNANEESFVAQMAAVHAQAAVVIAFGQKLSPALIAALGPLVINLHASLLPKYRGAAPINWAMIQGESETGLSVISLAQRMDGGLIYAQSRTPISPTETAGELHDRLSAMGPAVVAQVLTDFEAGHLNGQPQIDAQATRAPKLSKADSRIDFDQPPATLRARIHGLTPWPGVAATWVRQNSAKEQPILIRRVVDEPVDSDAATPPTPATTAFCPLPTANWPAPGTILENGRIAVQGGTIRLLELQVPGGRIMSFADFARGHPMVPGDFIR